MTKAKQANGLFMVKLSSRLLVELLSRSTACAADSQQGLIQLAQKVTAVAENAYARQDFSSIKEASELLITLPVPRAQLAGLWYQAFVKSREGQPEEAARILDELIAEPYATPQFRARAFQTLGFIHQGNGNFDFARHLYSESARYIRRESPADAYLLADSIILHSYAYGAEGESRRALKQLRGIEKLIDVIHNPLLTATYCNNVAVELLQLGRFNEAARYSRISCASPLAFAYPEWKKTALEIEQQAAVKDLVAVPVAVAVAPEPRKRPAQPKYLLIVLRYSPPVRVIRPVPFRQRVACANLTVALVASVARIRAPSILLNPGDPQFASQVGQGVTVKTRALPCFKHPIRRSDANAYVHGTTLAFNITRARQLF